VDSVLNQTYTNWELIIVDDYGEYKLDINTLPKDDRIRVLFNESNLGAAPTRQRGLENTRGKYIAFLDADDWWAEDFLTNCLKELQKDINSDGVYVQSELIFSGGVRTSRKYSEMGLTKIIETVIQYARPWQTGGILWRRESCGNWGQLKTNEDAWFEVSSAKFNKLLYLNYKGYFVDRTSDTSLSMSYPRTAAHVNHLLLMLMIYKKYNEQLAIKYRIILFHRLVRGYYKVLEHCPCDDISFIKTNFKSSLPFFSMLGLSKLLLLLLHKALQKTTYKINF
jgi:glycosyltransferase involved in cell wall biosynthesis